MGTIPLPVVSGERIDSLLSHGKRNVALAPSVVVMFSSSISRPPVGMIIGVHHSGSDPG